VKAQEADRRRVAFLTTELGSGGAERVVSELAVRLDQAAFEVVGVWCLAPAEGRHAAGLSAAGVSVRGAGVRGVTDLRGGLRRLGDQLRSARPDVLNAHLFHAAAAARLLARRGGVGRLVVTHHFNETRRWRFLLERLAGPAAAVTAVSPAVAARAAAGLKLGGDDVEVVPNGVDAAALAAAVEAAREGARRSLGIPAEARVIGTVGRLVPEKGTACLLEAFARLAAADPSLRLLCAGEGPLRAGLLARSGKLGLADRVLLPGFREDLAAVLAAVDVFALPSVTEGHPLSLLEAMAAGLPLAASRIPAVSEVLGSAAGGIVPTFAPGDAEGLALALGRLLEDAELAARCGRELRGIVAERFTVEAMVRGYESVFKRVAS
jgi:glycosyltransferase involved in cell wall biosynthesis